MINWDGSRGQFMLGSQNGHKKKNQPHLCALPSELCDIILSFLDRKDIIKLRLVSRTFATLERDHV